MGGDGVKVVNTGTPFVSDETHLQEFLDPLVSLPDEVRDSLEGPLQRGEVEEALQGLPTGRSPGSDGLPYEFYVAAFPIIGGALVEVLASFLERSCLGRSQREGLTRLLPKVKEIPRVDQLRPITLLQTDYKILTKILVARINPVLPLVLRSGQLCSTGGGGILHGVSNLVSALHYVEQRGVPAAVLTFDQWKAYDRVYIPFLLRVMRRMGFGPRILGWVEMLHTGNTTRFILNSLMEPVRIFFSVRQGDPLAMPLYLIFVESLLVQLGQGGEWFVNGSFAGERH